MAKKNLMNILMKKVMNKMNDNFDKRFVDEIRRQFQDFIEQYRSGALKEYKDEVISKFDYAHFLEVRTKDVISGMAFSMASNRSGVYLIHF